MSKDADNFSATLEIVNRAFSIKRSSGGRKTPAPRSVAAGFFLPQFGRFYGLASPGRASPATSRAPLRRPLSSERICARRLVWPLRTYHSNEQSAHLCHRISIRPPTRRSANRPLPASPRPSSVPAFLKLRLGVFERRHPVDRVIGPFTVSDQNHRRLSGPPRVA